MPLTLRSKIDENINENGNIGRKVAAPMERRRAALGDVGNRATTKINQTQKEIIDTKPVKGKNLKTIKPRVDTYWKKTNPVVTRKVTRSESLKSTTSTGSEVETNISKGPISLNVGKFEPKLVKTRTTYTAKVEHVQKTSCGNVNHTSSDSVDNPQQLHVKAVELTIHVRREESNLSRRSLTKMRAAVKKEQKPSVESNEPDEVKQEPADAIVSHSTNLLNEVEDIDINDEMNPILLSIYVKDIYAYLYKLELEFPIAKNHLMGQREVSPNMRAVLFDWLNEVHYQFHLVPETYHLTVSIVDRYLQAVKTTTRQRLQLVGITALFIASKYEELFPPEIKDFVFITDDTYNKGEILEMERHMLKALGFHLGRPLSIHFLRRFSKAASAGNFNHAVSKYFIELAAIEYTLSHYRPSEIAAASIFLTLRVFSGIDITDEQLWTPTLQYYTIYTLEHLRPIVCQLAVVVKKAPNAKLKSIYTKYKLEKFDAVSVCPELNGEVINKIISP